MMTIYDKFVGKLPGRHDVSPKSRVNAESVSENQRQLAAALADIDEPELNALVCETHELLHVAPDFVWWVARLANWETNRRAGWVPRWPPDSGPTVAPNVNARRMAGAMSMRSRLAMQTSRDTSRVAAFLDAMIRATNGRGNVQQPARLVAV